MQKDLVEKYPFYHAGELKDIGLFGAHEAKIEGITVKIEYTPCNKYGGQRAWFICPGCGKRIMKLFEISDKESTNLILGCRECLNLTYKSTRMAPPERRMYQKAKKITIIAKRLNLNRIDIERFQRWKIRKRKPKDMYRKTYQKLYQELKELVCYS